MAEDWKPVDEIDVMDRKAMELLERLVIANELGAEMMKRQVELSEKSYALSQTLTIRDAKRFELEKTELELEKKTNQLRITSMLLDLTEEAAKKFQDKG